MALPAILLLVPTAGHAQADSTWREHYRAAQAAETRGDLATARSQLLVTGRLLGNHPSIVIELARVAARQGDTSGVLHEIDRVAAMGVAAGAVADTVFDRYRALPAFCAAAARIAASESGIGRLTAVTAGPDSAAIVEDLVLDRARHRTIVSDVRHHRLWAVDRRGRWTFFGPALAPGWAPLGLAINTARGVLWVATAALPQAEGFVPADSGRGAILRVDLRNGAPGRRYDIPGRPAAPGDLTLSPAHDLFAGDGMSGAVYRIRDGGDSVEVIVPPGRLRGTQQPVVLPDGHSLIIPDYGRGLARIDARTGAITWLAYPDSVTLTGIDGMILAGQSLVAVQNGVTPSRVVLLRLDASFASVLSATIVARDSALAGEPTHVIAEDGGFLMVGGAGWAKYDDAGAPTDAAGWRLPRIVRVAAHR